MKQYGFFEGRVKSFLITVLLFGMLLLSRNTLISTSLLGFYRSQFLMILLIFLMAALFLILNWNDLKCIFTDKRIIIAVGTCGIVMLPMIVKRDWQMMYLSILMCLMFAVFLTFFVSYKDVAKVYVVSIAVLSAYSVVATYGLRLLPDSGLLSVPVFTNTNNVEFYNFGLAFVSQSYVKNRNFGIFREPGVYQYFLLLALFLNNFTISWQKTSKCWLINGILTVTMLTTMATGGFVELGILAVILFFHKKLYRSRWPPMSSSQMSLPCWDSRTNPQPYKLVPASPNCRFLATPKHCLASAGAALGSVRLTQSDTPAPTNWIMPKNLQAPFERPKHWLHPAEFSYAPAHVLRGNCQELDERYCDLPGYILPQQDNPAKSSLSPASPANTKAQLRSGLECW